MERSEAGRRLAYQRPSGRLGARIDRYPSKKRLGESCSFEKTAHGDSDPAARPVLVLDFGAQYVQLIARRVRERHAFARIVRHDITAERVRELEPARLDPLRRAVERLRARSARSATRRSSSWDCRSWGSATGCNWPAEAMGGQGRCVARARVRPCRVPCARSVPSRSFATSLTRRSSG